MVWWSGPQCRNEKKSAIQSDAQKPNHGSRNDHPPNWTGRWCLAQKVGPTWKYLGPQNASKTACFTRAPAIRPPLRTRVVVLLNGAGRFKPLNGIGKAAFCALLQLGLADLLCVVVRIGGDMPEERGDPHARSKTSQNDFIKSRDPLSEAASLHRLHLKQPIRSHNCIIPTARIERFVHVAELGQRDHRDCVLQAGSTVTRADNDNCSRSQRCFLG